MNTYIPIDCHFYDELEALATLREEALILYVADSGENLTVTSLIKDFFIVDKVEYMLLANGMEIRLDAIVSVNGMERPVGCRI